MKNEKDNNGNMKEKQKKIEMKKSKRVWKSVVIWRVDGVRERFLGNEGGPKMAMNRRILGFDREEKNSPSHSVFLHLI